LKNDLLSITNIRAYLPAVLTKSEQANQLLIKGLDAFYPRFNHILEPLMTCSLHIVVSVRTYLHELIVEDSGLQRLDSLVHIASKENYMRESILLSKKESASGANSMILFENHLLWLLKLQRMQSDRQNSKSLHVHVLDHFVRRDIAKKLAEEAAMDDVEAQTF